MLATKRLYVNANKEIYVICPACGIGMNGTLRDKKPFQVTVRCKSCHKKFAIELDYRRFYRKEAKFYGNIFCNHENNFTVMIKDVSTGGVRFQCIDCTQHLHINETVKLQFRIDDKKQSTIDVSVKICHKYDDGEFGAVFVPEQSSYESIKQIGFWLR